MRHSDAEMRHSVAFQQKERMNNEMKRGTERATGPAHPEAVRRLRHRFENEPSMRQATLAELAGLYGVASDQRRLPRLAAKASDGESSTIFDTCHEALSRGVPNPWWWAIDRFCQSGTTRQLEQEPR